MFQESNSQYPVILQTVSSTVFRLNSDIQICLYYGGVSSNQQPTTQ